MLNHDILLSIAQTFGTPTYVYDLKKIKHQFDYLRNVINWPQLDICYAMKANFNPDILNFLNSIGAHIDAVSPGDLQMAMQCGFDVSKIIYTANNMKESEVDEVAQTGVLFNIDALSRLEKYGKKYPGSQVCLRFNPDVVDGEHDKIKTGGDLTKFGILLESADEAAQIAERYRLKVVGLHEHTGSGLIKSDSILKAMKNIMSIASPQRFPDLEFLDFGGGFKVAYNPDEKQVDYKKIGSRITGLFSEFCSTYGRPLRLKFEPGKFLTAQAGALLIEVNTIKQNRSRTICGTDSGFPQLIRPMFYDAYHHIENISNPDGEKHTYDICGNICETGDRFAENRKISQISEGDILAICDAGAYCYAMGGFYNLRPMPAEVIIESESFYLSRKRLSSRDLIALIMNETCGKNIRKAG